jgi:Tol biopolymer transport system component
VVYVIGNGLVVQPLDDLQPVDIDTRDAPIHPFWSPDGSELGYFAEDKIWRVPAEGGTSVLVCDPRIAFTGGTGGTWTEDGRIIFGTGGSGLFEVPVQGGDEKEYLPLDDDESDLHEPFMLPGDRGVIFLSHRLSTPPDRICLYANGERKVLLELTGLRAYRPRYSNTGHILFRRPGSNGGVWAVPFDLGSLETTGDPFIVAAASTNGSASHDGTLAYLAGLGDESFVLRWVHRDGTMSEPVSVPGPGRGHPSFSPNGDRLVVAEYADENVDLWIYDLDRKSRTRFTFHPRGDLFPAWAPDGEHIYFWRAGVDSIYRKPADGTGSAEPVIDGGMPTLTPDMRYMAFKRLIKGRVDDIFYMDMESGEVSELAATTADEDAPVLSPTGGYLAYDSNESGAWHMYVTPFPSGDGKWQVSLSDYAFGTWGADGTALHYQTTSGDLYEVQFNPGPNGVELSTPELLFSAEEFYLPPPSYVYFKQSPTDTDRFILMTPLETTRRETSTDLTIVENWIREYQR